MSDILSSLLEGTLDQLADAPSFEPFKVGVHKVTIEFEELEVNKHPSVKLKMKLIETKELADTSDTPQVPGSEAEVLYMLDNDMGQGNLKKILTILNTTFKGTNLREIMQAAKGAECLVVTAQRQNKDKTQTYTEVKEIAVA